MSIAVRHNEHHIQLDLRAVPALLGGIGSNSEIRSNACTQCTFAFGHMINLFIAAPAICDLCYVPPCDALSVLHLPISTILCSISQKLARVLNSTVMRPTHQFPTTHEYPCAVRVQHTVTAPGIECSLHRRHLYVIMPLPLPLPLVHFLIPFSSRNQYYQVEIFLILLQRRTTPYFSAAQPPTQV